MSSEDASVHSTYTHFAHLPPCCMSVCPSFPQFIVIGCYNLKQGQNEDATQTRDGLITLLEVSDGRSIKEVESKRTASAVLDLHFAPWSADGRDLLGLCTSTGTFEVYVVTIGSDAAANLSANAFGQFQDSTLALGENTSRGVSDSRTKHEGIPCLHHLYSVQLFDTATLITSFAWESERTNCIVCTTTTGQVAVCELGQVSAALAAESRRSVECKVTELWPSHELEAWITIPTSEFYKKGVLSGGDDGKIIFFTDGSDQEGNEGQPSEAHVWKGKQRYGAGIIALTPLPALANSSSEKHRLLLTGSYDDHIRLLQLPMHDMPSNKPAVLTERNLGGGSWRIVVVDTRHYVRDGGEVDSFLLLVSCMYAGACLLRLQRSKRMLVVDGGQSPTSSWSFDDICWFKEHESMCYASAVVPQVEVQSNQQNEREYTFISTSFYDKRVCLWSVWLSADFELVK